MLNLVFFGTSDFAIPPLKALLDSGHEVLAVVTQPDRPKGRHFTISSPPVKIFAQGRNLPVLQPEDASAPEAVKELKALSPDLFVVVAFGQILKKELLDVPKLFSVNVHGSLLPKYRGAAPMNWALINGEEKTGVTIMKMNERLDEGEVIAKREVSIDIADDAPKLSEKLSRLGGELLTEALNSIENKSYTLTPQESEASYAPKIKREDGRIDWKKSAFQVYNQIRGLLPWPVAFADYEGKTLKIWKADVLEKPVRGDFPPGQVVQVRKNEGVVVQTGSGQILIRSLQLEGSQRMDAHVFTLGHKLERLT